MFYLNLIISYCLTALNICRYWQIVRQKNISIHHRKKLILFSLIISLLILINFIIQNVFTWCVVIETVGVSCSLRYRNNIVHIWNLTVVLIIPILIGLYMLFRSLKYLQNFHAQQRLVRRNHHRQLLIYSISFYSIWIILWSPLMFINFLDIPYMNESFQFIAFVANTLQILADLFIAFFLDKHFSQVWKKIYQWIHRQVCCCMNARVNPVLQIPIVR